MASDSDTADRVSTSGFDDFFRSDETISTPEPERNHPGTDQDAVLTLKEAVEFYKISEKTIRLRIAQGKIPARKEQGAKGLEWRIYPAGIPEEVAETSEVTEVELSHTGTSEEPDWNHHGTKSEVKPTDAGPQLDRLLDVIQKQSEKLEAANYRIGYLEAQSIAYEQQIKLLTDREHKRSGWSRFWSWFTGKERSK